MKLPRLTAEYSLGPAMQTYTAGPSVPAGPGAGAVTTMDFFSDIGSVFSGVLNKVPCLIGCGLPNALSLATECGLDPACWISHAPAALGSCIRQCLQ
jgi:hypothetical protein